MEKPSWETIYREPLTTGLVQDCYLQCVGKGNNKYPLHLDVTDRYLREMGYRTIPDEASLSL